MHQQKYLMFENLIDKYQVTTEICKGLLPPLAISIQNLKYLHLGVCSKEIKNTAFLK